MSDKENDQSTLTREVNPRKSFAQEVLEAALERERLGKERKEKLTNNKPETLLRRAGSSGKEATSDDNKKRKPRKSFRDKAAKFKAGTEKKEEKKTRTKTKISGKKKTDEKETGGRISKLKEQLSNLVRQSEQLAKDIARFEKDLLGKDQPAKKVGRPRKIRIESSDTNLVQSPKLESDGNEKPAENVDSEVDRGRQIIESFKRSLAVGERTKHLCRVRQPAAAPAAEVVKDDAAASNQQLEPSCFAERGPVQLVVIRPNPFMREKDLTEKLPIAPASSVANEKIAGQSKSIPLGGENKSKLPAIELPGSTLEVTAKPDDGQEELKGKKESDDVGLGLTPVKSTTTSLKEGLDPDELESVFGDRPHSRGRVDPKPELPERRQEVILGRNRFRANNSKKKGKGQVIDPEEKEVYRGPKKKELLRQFSDKNPVANRIAEKSGGETKEIMPRAVPVESNRKTGAEGTVEKKNKEAAGRGSSLLEEMKRERLKKQQIPVPLGNPVANPLQATIWRNKKYKKTPLTKWVSVRTLKGKEWTVDEADRIAGLFNGGCAGYCLLAKMKTVLIMKIGGLDDGQIKNKLEKETAFPLISNTTMDMSLSEATRDELAKI